MAINSENLEMTKVSCALLLPKRPVQRIPKELISIRVDIDTLEKLRATGRGWQTRVNEMLRKQG